jgi:crotonobetaine/carnitine-CoA ligase
VPSSLEGAVLEQEVAIIMKRYEFKEQALGQIIQDKAAAHPDRIFLEYEDGSTVSYQQMDDITNKIANGLTKLGLNKGEFVATFLPNSLDSIL